MMINKTLLSVPAAMLLLAGCGSDDDSTSRDEDNQEYSEVLTQFVEHAVLPTYASLKDEATELHSLVVALSEDKEQVTLDSACATWRAARVPWEQSEAFLFGPAEFRSLDPLLDSWPLDQTQLQQVLDSKQDISPEFVREGLGAVLRGFHTIEYLLFRNGEPRPVDSLTARELEYLVAVSQVLRDDAITLWALWHGADGITGLDAEVLESLEIDPGEGYAAEFLKAGEAGSRYVSQTDAISEIIEGCIGIADEVGNAKLAEPAAANDPLLVESWFSWNSLADFHNNVVSIQNSFYGGVAGYRDSTKSLASLLKEKDADLETTLAQNIQASLDAIDAVPHPFRNNLSSAKVDEAIDALNELTSTLEDVRSTLSN